MKKCFVVSMIFALCLGFTGIRHSFAAYTITFDEEIATDNGDPIGGQYDHLGIHFLTDTATLTDPAIQFYGSTILPAGSNNAIFWYPVAPADYPYPTTQYMALEKPVGEDAITGVALQLDSLCTQMEFNYRRPGSNDTTADITISFFDTTRSKTPFFTEQIIAYVFTPSAEDPDGDGWKDYASNLQEPFNLVTLSGNKKFSVDNLSITAVSENSDDDSTDPDSDQQIDEPDENTEVTPPADSNPEDQTDTTNGEDTGTGNEDEEGQTNEPAETTGDSAGGDGGGGCFISGISF
jgi:hypothetical protein